jgi:hypothetical protein
MYAGKTCMQENPKVTMTRSRAAMGAWGLSRITYITLQASVICKCDIHYKQVLHALYRIHRDPQKHNQSRLKNIGLTGGAIPTEQIHHHHWSSVIVQLPHALPFRPVLCRTVQHLARILGRVFLPQLQVQHV